jgi:Ca-activated chloride channel homolog
VLRMIAEVTGGTYVRLDQGNAINRVVSDLRRMQRAEGQEARRLEPKEQFAWFAALALILLSVDMLLFGAGVKLPQLARSRTAAVGLVLLATSAYGIGDLERGNRLYREGRYEEAIAAYQRVVESGDASPQVHYNLGTALLAVGRYPESEQHFQIALSAVDPELRQHTFYNLGNRFLTEGRAEADVARQGELLDAAIEAYRRSLRIMPDDVDAKWNLELALRDREENEQQQQNMPQQQDQQSDEDQDSSQQEQQEGGGGGSGAQGQAGEGQDAGSATDQQPMSQQDADRILSAIEQDERELTREKLRRGERRTPVLRDW